MFKEVQLSKTHQPLGICIYCLDSTSPLENEHVIPLAINGELVLPKSSCRRCADKINREFECEFLQSTMLDTRTHLGMRSRSKPRRGAKALRDRDRRLGMTDSAGVFKDWKPIDFDRYPLVSTFVRFGTPTILTGRASSENFEIVSLGAYVSPGEIPKVMALGPGEGVFTSFRPEGICREIAKISHGAVVSEIGLSGFTPLLNEVILGTDRHISHYVGGDLIDLPANGSLHQIVVGVLGPYVVARVRLFAKLGGPTYLVVVGKMKK